MSFPDDLPRGERDHFNHLVMALSDRSPALAKAFTKASTTVFEQLTVDQRTRWAEIGLSLSAHGWKSVNLACEMFAASEAMLRVASIASIVRLVDILDDVSVHSVELASSFLKGAPALFDRLLDENHETFLDLAETISARSKADIWMYFERGPDLLDAFNLPTSNKFVTLAVTLISKSREPPFQLLSRLSSAVDKLPRNEHENLYRLAADIAGKDVHAATEFLTLTPRLRELLTPENLEAWVEQGLAAGDIGAFFKLESITAENTLARLSGRVEFEREANMLQLFGQALAGEKVHVQPVHVLAGKRTGWQGTRTATTDGNNIFVPEYIDLFGNRAENLEAWRVFIAHQAGRLQFGSFGFRFGAHGHCLPSTLADREHRTASALSAMQRYFDLFDDRALVHTLFWLTEDRRIDACVSLEYPGLRDATRRIRRQEGASRPNPHSLGLRQAFVENLIQLSLEYPSGTAWPVELDAVITTAAGVLAMAARPGMNVQDSAEISAWLYDLAITLPSGRYPKSWEPIDPARVPRYDALPSVPPLPTFMTEGDDDYVPLPPAHWGDFKPEWIQTFEELMSQPDLNSLDPERLAELIEKSVEVADDCTDDLLQEVVIAQELVSDDADLQAFEAPVEFEEDADVIDWHHYDEWDFRANDYLGSWCRVGERAVPEGDIAYYEDTLARHHGLVLDIRKQFEMMRPESHRKIKNLQDGHEIDLEKAIEFYVDKKAGTGPTARFYARRDKIERSVAAAFLLDMSWSTDEPAGHANDRGRRIIDLERDATVLIIEALEAIGDAYGIFGFSGYGRKNVSYHVIKNLEEPHSDTVRKRIDEIQPLRSTRMGAAIRHTRTKLDAYPARVKLMIVISDGRPQDQGYGEHNDDFDYAVHDTHQALLEAKHAGVVPFLITVDKDGPDYLKAMCGDMGYEIVEDLASLPRRLPSLYRYLATG